jgi:flagellar protein FlgJ
MSGSFGIDSVGGPGSQDREIQLRRLSQELEGLFIRQLFRAMRGSLPEGGLLERSSGEELFTSLMDDQLASLAAQKMERGLGEALYRQLVRRVQADVSHPTQ